MSLARTLCQWYQILSYFRTLRKNTWLKFSDLKEMQRRSLKAIVKYAYENVSFYHQRFNSAKIKPEDIRSVEDLHKLPILTKSEMQRNLNTMIAKDVDMGRCNKEKTSGSTGIPLTVIADKRASYLMQANQLRYYIENGCRLLRDKYIEFRSYRHPYPRSYLGTLLPRFGFFRKVEKCAQDPMEDLISELVKLRPDIIEGIPSLLVLLAQDRENTGMIRPRLIFSGGELLEMNHRAFISSVFGAEVVDVYGCTEAGCVAWECPERVGYHMNMDLIATEFVRDGENVAPGERGELILTPLWNYTMPLIRYRIGDIGVPSGEECPCGRGLPLMRMIEGRSEDFIILPSGRIVPPIVIPRFFEHVEGIAEHKIIQEKRDTFRVLLVLKEGYDQNISNRVKEGLRHGLREEVAIECEVVDAMPRDKSGKLRRVISRVPSPRF